jgi:hypothetical protein
MMFRLDFLEAAKMAILAIEGDLRAPGHCGIGRQLADVGETIAAAARKARLDGDVREIFGGQRIASA